MKYSDIKILNENNNIEIDNSKKIDIHDKNIIKQITYELIKEKKKTGHYNVSIKYKGIIPVSMAISTFDSKPFNKKQVRIYIAGITEDGSTYQADLAYLKPVEAGYTEKEVNDMLLSRGFKSKKEK